MMASPPPAWWLDTAPTETAGLSPAEAREALKGDDINRIKRAQENLTKASHKLAEVMYREAQSKDGATSTEGGGQPKSKPPEGDVVDAEFEDLGEKK